MVGPGYGLVRRCCTTERAKTGCGERGGKKVRDQMGSIYRKQIFWRQSSGEVKDYSINGSLVIG